MSANPLELFTEIASLNKPAGLEERNAFRVERRKWTRSKVHWPVVLFSNQVAEAIETITQNLSSGGFYCLSKTSFTVGENVICTLRVPTHDPHRKERERLLECRVRVVRVEALDECFGLACQMEDYRISPAHT
jgi:hypothetical protein